MASTHAGVPPSPAIPSTPMPAPPLVTMHQLELVLPVGCAHMGSTLLPYASLKGVIDSWTMPATMAALSAGVRTSYSQSKPIATACVSSPVSSA